MSKQHFAKYQAKQGCITKDGHTMLAADIAKDLNRKSFLEEHVLFLNKQLETAKVDTIVTFGCELIDEHESNFLGGENQIQAICQVVHDQVTSK